MPAFEWHLKFALQMAEMAEKESSRNAWVACHAVLRAFEEVIDAYCANEDLHFHDDYPIEAWEKRTKWLSSKTDLLDEWNRIQKLCASGNQSDNAAQMLHILKGRLAKMTPRT